MAAVIFLYIMARQRFFTSFEDQQFEAVRGNGKRGIDKLAPRASALSSPALFGSSIIQESETSAGRRALSPPLFVQGRV